MVLLDKVLVPSFKATERKIYWFTQEKEKKNELNNNNNKVFQLNADENITINGKCLLFQNKKDPF